MTPCVDDEGAWSVAPHLADDHHFAAPSVASAAATSAVDDYIPDEAPPKDACGVFAVWAPGEEVAKLTYYGIYALQHRGQEAAGMAVSDGSAVVVYKDLGLVAQVFDEPILGALTGHLAIGHTRYSTTGSCTWENAQPSYRPSGHGGGIALGHNGNLTNTAELAATFVEPAGRNDPARMGDPKATSDSDLITAMLAGHPDLSLEAAAMEVLPTLRGAFSLVFMDENTIYAARDPHGVRPLVLGRLERGWVVASESAALDIVGASFVREVEPGELIAIDEHGLRTQTFAEATPKGCLFEYVYLARPDTAIAGRSVQETRVEVGRRLAREHPADADLVIPVPESGTPAAVGYAEASGIPYGIGLVKNAYVGRTFIQPSDTIRQLGIRLKLNPLRTAIAGKRLVVVDDTIVRGNTQRALVRMLREAGAREVHVRISAPPVQWPCFYGIDFASRAELIANGLTVEQVCASIGADSLGYTSLEELISATTIPAERLCQACFTGDYPIELPAPELLGKHMLEGISRVVETHIGSPDPSPDSGYEQVLPGVGAEDALQRP
jgi:amidophosphoribosyltransferase